MAIDPNMQMMADKISAARGGRPGAPPMQAQARPAAPAGNPAEEEMKQLLQSAMQSLAKVMQLMGAEESGPGEQGA